MTLSRRDELRQAARTRTWQATGIRQLEGDDLTDFMDYYRDVYPDFTGSFQEVWSVSLIERRGLLQPELISNEMSNEKDARVFFELFKEEQVVSVEDPKEVNQRYTKLFLDAGLWSEYWSEFQKDRETASDKQATEVLIASEIIDSSLRTHTSVLEFSGEERVKELQMKFPATWQYIVELEFAMLNLSKDSPAYIASAVRYCKYFTKDLILAGYLIRDLEVLLLGAENKHRSALIQRENSKEGKRRSAARMLHGRYLTLIEKMEEMLVSPVKWRLKPSAKTISFASQAARELEKKNPNWTVGGAKSVENYLVDIRCNPDLEDLKSKLLKIEGDIKNIKNQHVKHKST